MEESVVSGCEKLNTKLRDLDALLDMIGVVIASPEASLHTVEAIRLLSMSRRMVKKCQSLTSAK
ncbi:TPA: hypothetical protein ACOEHG_004912 [Enterobacter ludwigii]